MSPPAGQTNKLCQKTQLNSDKTKPIIVTDFFKLLNCKPIPYELKKGLYGLYLSAAIFVYNTLLVYFQYVFDYHRPIVL